MQSTCRCISLHPLRDRSSLRQGRTGSGMSPSSPCAALNSQPTFGKSFWDLYMPKEIEAVWLLEMQSRLWQLTRHM